jgi:uncharacterized LabA/DUF88 family protein
MDRVAVFVDAGYLFAQGSCLFKGEKASRGEIDINLEKALQAFDDFACRISGLPLLRIYWYDGTSTGPTPQHIALGFLPRTKVRLGFVNNAGQQKGVDSLIVTDMITLARNRSMSDAVLLSGDEDIRVGVQQAQEFGVRVHLLGITPCRGSQSLFLLQEADTTHEWTKNDISPFLSLNEKSVSHLKTAPPISPEQPEKRSSVLTKTMEDLASEAAEEVDIGLIDGLINNFESLGRIPTELDRPLVGRAKKTLGLLTPFQLSSLRKAYVAAMKRRLLGK